jgi:hypothetical protein
MLLQGYQNRVESDDGEIAASKEMNRENDLESVLASG